MFAPISARVECLTGVTGTEDGSAEDDDDWEVPWVANPDQIGKAV